MLTLNNILSTSNNCLPNLEFQMKYFVAILFLSAGAMAKTMPMAGKMYMPAEAREATFTPGSYDGFDPSYSCNYIFYLSRLGLVKASWTTFG